MAELGFVYDCSVFPSTHEFGGIPNFPATPAIIKTTNGILKELPINIGDFWGRKIVYTGGGYFRVMPYSKIRKSMLNETYTMSYFHPSDFDPHQPHMPHLSMMRQIKNRVGLRGAFGKFCRYLSDFDFVNIHTADSIIDWSECKILRLDEI